MKSLFSRFALFLFVVILSSRLIHAEVTDHLPSDALGYMTIRNMEATNDKIQKLFTKLEIPLPGPIAFLKTATGLDKGLNDQGDLMVALLPTDEVPWRPNPMVLISVSDYAAFASALGGDPSGEISAIDIQNQEMYLAKKGEYALLMDLNSREMMEKIVRAKEAPLRSFTQHKAWITEKDISVAILPKGVELLVAQGKTGISEQIEQMERDAKEFGYEEQLESMKIQFNVMKQFLDISESEIESITAGLGIDSAENVKLGLRVDAVPGKTLSSIGDQKFEPIDHLASLPAGPFVIAVSGPFSSEWNQQMTDKMIGIFLANPDFAKAAYGIEDFNEDDVKFLKSLTAEMYKGATAVDFCLQPGTDDQPIYSNLFAGIKAGDSQALLKSMKSGMDKMIQWQTKRGAEQQATQKYTEDTVAGKPGLKFEADFSNLPNVGDNLDFLSQMFGDGGIMEGYFGEVDPKQTLMAFASREISEKAIASVREGKSLKDDLGIAETKKLLPTDPHLIGYISPQGSVAWFKRVLNMIMGQFGGGGPEVPAFPDSAPIGFAGKLTKVGIEFDAAVPATTIDAVKKYADKIKQDFGG